MSLFESGVRPHIDQYLTKKAEEERDYGDYWGASSAGYCMRLNILKRLRVPPVSEIKKDALRTQRVFEAGHIFHEWVQRITKNAGISIAQEIELQDEDLMVRGHFDDLILEDNKLILYDYKTANSQAFNYKKDTIGHYHKMQLGTYMYMLKSFDVQKNYKGGNLLVNGRATQDELHRLTEARILQISKDDMRMREYQLLWSDELKDEIENYWIAINAYWRDKTLPPCTCLDHDGGFMGRRSSKGKIYNPFFFNEQPCSIEWAQEFTQVKEFLNNKEK